MTKRPRLRDIRKNFFKEYLKDFRENLEIWKILFVASRFCKRTEGLLQHYWPKAQESFIKKLMQVYPLVDKATGFIRVRSLYTSEELEGLLMQATELGSSGAGQLYMTANPLPLDSDKFYQEGSPDRPGSMFISGDVFELWEEIIYDKPKSIVYPADSVVASMEHCLLSAWHFIDAVDTNNEDEEYDLEDVQLTWELGTNEALKSILHACEAFDFLGSRGWKNLQECFFYDMEFIRTLPNFEMPRYPQRSVWVNGPPLNWLDYEPGTLKHNAINRVFVSYCWEGEKHKRWVEWLVRWLNDEGLEVIWDMWDSSYGSSLSYFMQTSVEESEHILMILTPEYARKANEGEGGVGAEWKLIKNKLDKNPDTTNFVGLLKEGDWKQSSPLGFQDRMGFDFSTMKLHAKNRQALLRFLHNLPEKRRFT